MRNYLKLNWWNFAQLYLSLAKWDFLAQRSNVFLSKFNYLLKFPTEIIGVTILILLCTIVKEKLAGYWATRLLLNPNHHFKDTNFGGTKFHGWHTPKLRFGGIKFRIHSYINVSQVLNFAVATTKTILYTEMQHWQFNSIYLFASFEKNLFTSMNVYEYNWETKFMEITIKNF